MATTTVSGEPFLEILQGSGGGPGPGGAADVVVIDVREPHELAGGRLQDSFAALGVTARYGEGPWRLSKAEPLRWTTRPFEHVGLKTKEQGHGRVHVCGWGSVECGCQVAGQQGFNDT